MHVSLYTLTFPHTCLEEKFLGCRVYDNWVFKDNTILFFKTFVPIDPLTQLYSQCTVEWLTHILTFVTVRLLYLCKLSGNNWDIVVVFLFIYSITNENEHMFIEDLVSFSVKCAIMTFIIFVIIYCFSFSEWFEAFTRSWYKSLVGYLL